MGRMSMESQKSRRGVNLPVLAIGSPHTLRVSSPHTLANDPEADDDARLRDLQHEDAETPRTWTCTEADMVETDVMTRIFTPRAATSLVHEDPPPCAALPAERLCDVETLSRFGQIAVANCYFCNCHLCDGRLAYNMIFKLR